MRLLSKLKTKTHLAILFIFSITVLSCGDAITEMRRDLLGLEEISTVKVETPSEAFTTDLPATVGSTENPIYQDSSSWKGVFYTSRKVKLSPYYIGETEVTYFQWRYIYNWAINHGYDFVNAGMAGKSGKTATANSPLPEDSTYCKHPVTKVSWQDCIVWCNAYTEMTKGEEHCVYRSGDGDDTIIRKASEATDTNLSIAQMKKNMKLKGFRLPTEAEWEFAARYEKGETNDSDQTAVKYGENLWLTKLNYASGATKNFADVPATKLVAWFGSNSSSGITHEVGTRAANKSGLFDMSGNVFDPFLIFGIYLSIKNRLYLFKIKLLQYLQPKIFKVLITIGHSLDDSDFGVDTFSKTI